GKRGRGAGDPHSVTNERGRPRVPAIFLGGKSLPRPSSLRVKPASGVFGFMPTRQYAPTGRLDRSQAAGTCLSARRRPAVRCRRQSRRREGGWGAPDISRSGGGSAGGL